MQFRVKLTLSFSSDESQGNVKGGETLSRSLLGSFSLPEIEDDSVTVIAWQPVGQLFGGLSGGPLFGLKTLSSNDAKSHLGRSE